MAKFGIASVQTPRAIGVGYYVVLSRILQMDFAEFTFHALGCIRTRSRGESYWTSPLPTLLVRFLIGEGEIDYVVLVLLTGSSVILSTSAEASSCFRRATKQKAGASEALGFR